MLFTIVYRATSNPNNQRYKADNSINEVDRIKYVNTDVSKASDMMCYVVIKTNQ